MSLKDGTYQIFSHIAHKTSGQLLRLAYYQGNLLLVNDSSNVLVNVTNVSGDKYKMQFRGTDKPNWFAPAENVWEDDRVFLQDKEYEWSINQAGDDKTFKIHIPEQDFYWVVPDATGNETRVRLEGAMGKTGELWTFEPK